MKNSLSFREARTFPITDYLSGLGHEPAKVRGSDLWYYSPFRHERTPSFKVNTKSNIWYDHGSGEGGTLVDLGARLHQCSLQEFLEMLSQDNSIQPSVSLHQPPVTFHQPKLEIISSSPLASPDLRDYLISRGIDLETARQYCSQVDFRINSGFYSAIGFPNQSGGFELRNRWFKGSSSPKDVSIIRGRNSNGPNSKLMVLEGFMDFLSL